MKYKLLFTTFVLLLLLPAISGTQIKESSIKIRLSQSQWGGVQIEQTSIDNYYPCYLQPDGNIYCPKITLINKVLIYIFEGIPSGIPMTDYRKPLYETIQLECNPDDYMQEQSPCAKNKQEEWRMNQSEFKGFYTQFLDYNKAQDILLDTSRTGKVSIGFGTNNFTITSFTSGSGINCTIDVGGVILSNSHIPIDNDVMAAYFFDSDANDNSGNGNDGLVIGATHNFSWYQFDRINDYINISNSDSININGTSFTMCIWFKPNEITNVSTSDDDYLFAKNDWNQYKISLFTDKSRFSITTGDTVDHDGPASVIGEWNFMCGRYNGTHVSTYINGIWNHTADTGSITSSTSPMLLGSKSSVVDVRWLYNGLIDEFWLSNRTYSVAEIEGIFNDGLFIQSPRFCNYTSLIFDAGLDVNWTNMTWTHTGDDIVTNVTMYARAGSVITKPDVTDNDLRGFWTLNGTENCLDYFRRNNGTANGGVDCGGDGTDTLFDSENVTLFLRSNTQDLNMTGTQDLNLSDRSFTILAWIKKVSLTKGGIFTSGFDFDNNVGYAFLTDTNNNLELFMGNQHKDSNASVITLNQWHYVGVTYNTTHITHYVDGTGNIPQAITKKDTPSMLVEIGAEGSNHFDGNIAYLSIWNRSLTQDEILNWSAWTGELINKSLGNISTLPSSRFLQYQAVLETSSLNNTPILTEVLVNYVIEAVDSCTPPAINTNYEITVEDDCTLTTNTNLGAGNLTLVGDQGWYHIDANLTVASFINHCLTQCNISISGGNLFAS